MMKKDAEDKKDSRLSDKQFRKEKIKVERLKKEEGQLMMDKEDRVQSNAEIRLRKRRKSWLDAEALKKDA